MTSEKILADIGVTGMGVMGSNLARNFARNGYKVAIHNRSQAKTNTVMSKYGDEAGFIPTTSLNEFVQTLSRPRCAIIMVKAGGATDAVINDLANLMEPGDIIVDCGNSLFSDTMRREKALANRGLNFVGCGVSGGEEGALWGPAIMPGGPAASYDRLGPMLEKIAGKAPEDGAPCCTHVGENGAGHFVKMIHNGIEYADMQVIGESYDLLRTALGLDAPEIARIFAEWNQGDLNSYLMEISAEVLAQTDHATGKPLVDMIKDVAGQKGTGTWTVQVAAQLGVPVTGIAEATFARGLSSSIPQRELAVNFDGKSVPWAIGDDARDAFIEDVRQALYASKIVAYSQGFNLIQAGSAEYGWNINLADMARIWRAGCIIRARFLGDVTRAFEHDGNLALLLADDFFQDKVQTALPSWRRVVSMASMHGVSIPMFSSSLSYFDGVRAGRLPANLIQAQRDFFGAHTYARIDKPGVFHTLWSTDNRVEEQW